MMQQMSYWERLVENVFSPIEPNNNTGDDTLNRKVWKEFDNGMTEMFMPNLRTADTSPKLKTTKRRLVSQKSSCTPSSPKNNCKQQQNGATAFRITSSEKTVSEEGEVNDSISLEQDGSIHALKGSYDELEYSRTNLSLDPTFQCGETVTSTDRDDIDVRSKENRNKATTGIIPTNNNPFPKTYERMLQLCAENDDDDSDTTDDEDDDSEWSLSSSKERLKYRMLNAGGGRRNSTSQRKAEFQQACVAIAKRDLDNKMNTQDDSTEPSFPVPKVIYVFPEQPRCHKKTTSPKAL